MIVIVVVVMMVRRVNGVCGRVDGSVGVCCYKHSIAYVIEILRRAACYLILIVGAKGRRIQVTRLRVKVNR